MGTVLHPRLVTPLIPPADPLTGADALQFASVHPAVPACRADGLLRRSQPPALAEATLILASQVFYTWWDPRFLPLLIGQAGVTWLLAETYFRRGGRYRITLGIVWNIALPAFFKYAAFLAGALVGLAVKLGWDRQRFSLDGNRPNLKPDRPFGP